MENDKPPRDVIKGNARCRAHALVTDAGTTRYLLVVYAYNSWADQWKVVLGQMCLSREEAEDVLTSFREQVRGFSWEDNDLEWDE